MRLSHVLIFLHFAVHTENDPWPPNFIQFDLFTKRQQIDVYVVISIRYTCKQANRVFCGLIYDFWSSMQCWSCTIVFGGMAAHQPPLLDQTGSLCIGYDLYVVLNTVSSFPTHLNQSIVSSPFFILNSFILDQYTSFHFL